MSKIKLWKNNTGEEYEIKINEIIKKFIESKYFKRSAPFRYLAIFITIDLNSAFEIEDYDKIIDEYFRQKKELEV